MNPLLHYYLQIKQAHIHAVIASGVLFAIRGLLVVGFNQTHWGNHWALRWSSYAIDTTLLTCALMLSTILHQYPFVQGWLTVKVFLLVVYIVLGSFALKRASSRARKAGFLLAALMVYGFIATVARAHDPWGAFRMLWS